jgi:cytochrome c oxidase subunit II
MKLLILLVVILGVIAIIQLAKVNELSSVLRKRREEDISYADNKLNATLMLVFMFAFYISVIFLYVRYGNYLPPSASEHGEVVDMLMDVNIILITVVFFVVQTLLFTFSYRYYYREDRKAKFFPHDNRLELYWTVIPSIVLAFIIIYGLRTWNQITDEASENAIIVEVYSKQFDWTVRYQGDDNRFGQSDYNLITTSNPLGIVTASAIAEKLAEIEAEIASLEATLASDRNRMPVPKVKAAEDKIKRLIRHKRRIMDLKEVDLSGVGSFASGADDRIVKGEFHLPVGREVEFVFRSRDVTHSAYMPHFRAQMNTVPGLPTRFKMTPTITTDSMRTILNNPNFDYVLLCNKVCGAAHFNMQINLVIDKPEAYEAWLKEQKTFIVSEVKDDKQEIKEIETEDGANPVTAVIK